MDTYLRRINVVGVSGSGKTTYAQRVAERLDIPYIELDALFWGPNWTESPRDEFRSKVEQVVKGEKWSIDGNYSRVRDIVWGKADTVVRRRFYIMSRSASGT